MASRSTRSENICASSERICRCFSVAFSGTSRTKTRLTGLPSGASKGTGCASRTNAPSASLRPLMRPCGMATPCPSPVEPSRSRASRLSNTRLLAMPSWFSNSSPACSNKRFLLEAWRSRTTCDGVRSLATRLISGRANYSPSYALLVELVLVPEHLAVELVGEQIDRRVKIVLLAFAMQILAAHVQRDLGLLPELVHGEDDVGVDHVVEMPGHALQLRLHVAADGGSHFEMMAAHVQVHGHKAFLWLTGGICSDSRYFAMVRRATTIPCSPRICEMRASESGARVSSAATSCLISARIAVEDAAPPASVATWLPKKYFSSKVPRGVAMYFCVVTREMVLSWRPSVLAISRSTSGRIATSPCSRKWRWRSTIACDTRRIVSKRCCTFLISHLASCSCEETPAPPLR